MSLLQLAQCQTFPQEIYRELIGQLKFLMGVAEEEEGEDGEDVVMEERMEVMGWLNPSAGVAVQ